MAKACTFTVYAQNVTDQDTDDPPNLMVADYVATFQTVAAPPDDAPAVESTSPDNGATDVARDASLSVTFNEPVDVTAGSFGISCTKSFAHATNITGGPLTFTLHPFNDFAYDDSCTFTVHAENVTDQDTDDPPDVMAADHVVTFQTVAAPPVVDDAPAVESTSPGDERHRRRPRGKPVGDLRRARRCQWRLVRHHLCDEPRSHRGRERRPRHVQPQPRHRLRL